MSVGPILRSGTSRMIRSPAAMATPLPTPGGPTRNVYRFGYRSAPIVRTHIFRSIAAATNEIAAHRRRSTGEGRISVYSMNDSIQLLSRRATVIWILR